MKPRFPVLAYRAALVTAVLVVACILHRGDSALAQGDPSPAGQRANVRLIDIDEMPMTTGENAKLAERIVWARCLSVEVHKLGGANIETYFEFEILQGIKGTFAGGHRPGARFVIAIPEGQVGEFRSESLPPFPKFEPGDEAVLLVGPTRQRSPGAVISPTQSTYRMRSDAQGHKTVTPRPTGMTIYRAATGQAYERMPGVVTVEDFLFSLRKLGMG